MAKKQVSAPAPAPANRPPYMLIEEIRVQGYKSLVDATLHVRPLTLLAGTNSSGKSSIMQPLLLIKQTMEAPYQPAGALVLDGAHVQAETAGELVSRVFKDISNTFSVSLNGQGQSYHKLLPASLKITYKQIESQFELINQDMLLRGQLLRITPETNWGDVKHQFSISMLASLENAGVIYANTHQVRAFLQLFLMIDDYEIIAWAPDSIENMLGQIMHIPGLRNAPERSYPSTNLFGVRNHIKGTFDQYVAGTVSQWQDQENTEALAKLNDYLRRLGLTDSVTAKVKNANKVELSVSRLPAGTKGRPRKADMVNIADVGIGVSQVLPILVALIAAQEGQIVYVEQPELHLHPKAQVVMAELLAEAANRGVRVIVETHSSLLLLTVQTLIAQDRIKNTDVALHWFARDAKGATTVDYVQPDEDGAYGEWPEDFGDVELRAQDAYLTAVGERHFGNAGK